jgi:hypothetical protein
MVRDEIYMNNTKTLAIVAIFMAATLVVGTFAATATTQTALAYQQKKRGGSQENSKDGNTVTLQACKQDGTESGFDNSLAQECQNVICTHPGDNASCVRENGAVNNGGGAVKDPCKDCFTTKLTLSEQTAFINAVIHLGFKVSSIEDICKIINTHTVSAKQIETILIVLVFTNKISEDNARALFNCLQQAGLISVEETLTFQK